MGGFSFRFMEMEGKIHFLFNFFLVFILQHSAEGCV